MGLTGGALLWFLGLATVGLPLVGVFLLPRLGLPGPVRVPARLLAFVAAQLAAVLLVGAALNDYAYFYGSWGDLLSSAGQVFSGTSSAAVPVIPHPDSNRPGAGNRPGVSVLPAHTGGTVPARWPSSGRMESVRIRGSSSGLSTHAYVWLPPQYFQARYAHTTFPAVEVLSGYPATDTMLVRRLAFQRALLREVDAHRARPMVLVLMRPTISYPRDTECTDVPNGPQVETFYAQDVPLAVSGAYRVQPTGWGAAGVSTGGYCATKITMTYPAVFRAAVSLSGYYQALSDYTTGDLWGGSSMLRDLNSPEWRLAHLPAPDVSLLLTTSRDEGGPYGYGDTRRMLAEVRPPLRVSTIIAAHGGHTFTTWKPEIPAALHWLSPRVGDVATSTKAVSPGTGGAARPPAGSLRSAGGRPHSGGHRRARAAG